MTAAKPRLLDVFCGAGGCSAGYARAGFDVVGVDIHPQPHYPFGFILADALNVLRDIVENERLGHGLGVLRPGERFAAIHASPPCQGYSVLGGDGHALLIEPVRELLEETSLPYVIENIPDAAWALREPTLLCGSSFGLRVRRHRLFETSWPLMGPSCAHGLQSSNPHRIRAPYVPAKDAIVPVYGGGQVGFPIEKQRAAMGIDWMSSDEIKDAIPPAYTELIGGQLLDHLRVKAAA